MPTATTSFSFHDIVTLASAGFMGLAAATIVALMFFNRTPPTQVLVTTILVILIGASAQLLDKYMGYFVKVDHWVSVNIQPSPSTFGVYVLGDDSQQADLHNKPYIWLAAGPPNCQPGEDLYDGKGCPSFGRTFPLLSNTDTINVSVEAIMKELRGRLNDLTLRLKKAQIAGSQLATSQASGQDTAELPFSQDVVVPTKGH